MTDTSQFERADDVLIWTMYLSEEYIEQGLISATTRINTKCGKVMERIRQLEAENFCLTDQEIADACAALGHRLLSPVQ